MIKSLFILGFTTFAGAAFAQSGAPVVSDEARELARTVFEQADADGSGAMDAEEGARFGDLVFVSMDSGEDGAVSWEEFVSWGFGFGQIAENTEQWDEFATAERILFDFWDRDNDSAVSREEFDFAQRANGVYADLDENGELDLEEFTQGSLPNIAYRSALRSE